MEIIKAVQVQAFPDEIELLRRLKPNPTSREDVKIRKASLRKNSALFRLDPFLYNEGILRVGGRIHRADVPFHVKHPAIIPRKGHITSLIIRYYRERDNHQGRGFTLNEIRENGLWIIGGGSAGCVMCRKLRGTVGEQKMADLPLDRLQPAPPFTFCGVDFSAHFTSKTVERNLSATVSCSCACRRVPFTLKLRKHWKHIRF